MVDEPSSNNTPADPPDLARLKAQNALLEQRAAIAENRNKLIGANFPSDVQPLKGETKIAGDHPIEGEILAYKALIQLSADIANKIAALAKKPDRILIHSEADIELLLGYQAFLAQVEVIKTHIEKETKEAEKLFSKPDAHPAIHALEHLDIAGSKSFLATEAGGKAAEEVAGAALGGMLGGAPVALASAAIRSAISLISLFRADVSLNYSDLAIGDRALIAAVSARLAEAHFEVYDPSLMPPHLMDLKLDITNKLEDCDKECSRLEGARKKIAAKQSELKNEIEDLTKRIAAGKETVHHDALRRELETKQHRLDAFDAADAGLAGAGAAMTDLQAALTKADDKSGISPLTKILHAEKLAKVATGAHWLWLKVVTAGGGCQTRQTLWGLCTTVSYSGGCVVEFALFDGDGKLVTAAVLPGYTGFLQLTDGRQTTATIANVNL